MKKPGSLQPGFVFSALPGTTATASQAPKTAVSPRLHAGKRTAGVSAGELFYVAAAPVGAAWNPSWRVVSKLQRPAGDAARSAMTAAGPPLRTRK